MRQGSRSLSLSAWPNSLQFFSRFSFVSIGIHILLFREKYIHYYRMEVICTFVLYIFTAIPFFNAIMAFLQLCLTGSEPGPWKKLTVVTSFSNIFACIACRFHSHLAKDSPDNGGLLCRLYFLIQSNFNIYLLFLLINTHIQLNILPAEK